MNKRIRLAMLPLAISALLAVTPVMAQNTAAAISGQVVNSSGQPISNATVTIVHEPSGTTKIVKTDAEGRYNSQGMRVGGPFDVTVSKDGMQSAERDDVYLQLAQDTAINLIMMPSDQSAEDLGTISVTANALAQTFSPYNKGTGTSVSQRELEAMPTPGRSIQDIVRLDPRVTITNRAEGKISALGQNYRYNNITVDSVGANDPFGLNANGLATEGTPISQDTIAAYNISTANYDVETRRGLGANVDAVTKSGTNEYHGSVYYAFQDKDWVGDFQDRPFNGYDRKWTGGGTIGGPIIKDKLFFFASYEQSEQIGAGASWGPEGSGSPQVVEGVTEADVQAVRDIASSYGMSGLGGLTGGGTSLQDKRYLAKLDWNISNNHRASFTWRRTKETQPNILGGDDNVTLSSGWTTKNTDNKSYALHLYDDWSENFSSTTTLSYKHFNRVGGPYNGVPLPAITVHVGGFRGPEINFGTNYSYQANSIDTKTLFAAWAGNWYIGDHTLKFGFDYQEDKKYNLFLQNSYGSYSFDSIDQFADADYSTYRYNRPADGLVLDDVAAAFKLKQWGLFLQDTWQVDDQLSLQYGVRVDIPKTDSKPLYNPAFADAGFKTLDGKTLKTNQYTVDGKQAVQPRVSFNYQFNTERMMQLRGGFGLFVTDPPAVWIGNIYSNTGVNSVGYLCETFRGCTPPPFSPDPNNQPDGAAGASQMTVNTLDPDFNLPSAYKFSLGLDAELPWWGLIGTVDYERVMQKDAIWYQNLNLGAATGTLPDGRSTFYSKPNLDPRADGQYERANANSDFSDGIINLASTNKGQSDSFTVQLKKPFQNDWSAMIGFTYSRATDVNPGLSSVAYSSWKQQYVVNPSENLSSTSNYETPMRAIASLTWRHAFFGDYYTRVSAFYDGRDGSPYSWSFGNDANGDSYYHNDLVYIPRKGDVEFKPGTSQDKIDQFYSYIASNDYLSGHQGQIAGRNADRAPWFNQLDLGFSQELPGFFDGAKGEIRLDIYNFLNLLDSDWGTEKRASFPGYRDLADYYGVDPATGKYIYDISGSSYKDDNGNYKPKDLPYNTYPDDSSQRWAAQLTVRYTF